MTTLEIVPFSEVEPGEWDAAAEASSSAWVWHLSPVVEGLAAWPRHSNRSFAIRTADGSLVAIAPFVKVSDKLIRVLDASRLHSIGGPAIRDGLAKKLRRQVVETMVAAIDDILLKEKASWAEAMVAPVTPSVLNSPVTAGPLAELGFADCSRLTWMVELGREEESVRAGYSQLTRRLLRRAAEEPFEIREASGAADCCLYYRLYEETCARTGAAQLPPAYMEAIFRSVVPSGRARILFLVRKGAVVAAQNTGIWKGGALYWTGASLDERGGGDNRLLFDAQIIGARSAGCRYYDTGQAYPFSNDPKERGLSDFKSSFGATLCRFPHGRRLVRSRSGRMLAGIRLARAVGRGELP
jgi:hypothetical protein